MNNSALDPWLGVQPIAPESSAALRRRAIFECCKWDPQVEDVETLAPMAVVLRRSAWEDLKSAAEALSAARPGARREALESYVKRLEKLESLAHAQKGVQKAYAIQAGREIRVIVRQEDVTDSESFQLSRELAKKIEQELTYPGQIKVTVIRESRYIEYAK